MISFETSEKKVNTNDKPMADKKTDSRDHLESAGTPRENRAVQHAIGHGDELAIDLTESQARLLKHKAEAGAWAWAALQVDGEGPATEAEA